MAQFVSQGDIGIVHELLDGARLDIMVLIGIAVALIVQVQAVDG